MDNRSVKKHWKVPTDTTIKQYTANVLCEDRANAKYAKEEAPQEKQEEVVQKEGDQDGEGGMAEDDEKSEKEEEDL